MSSREGIVFALFDAWEAAQSMELSVGMETFATAREYLMGIGLVADIPHDAIFRGIEHIMESHGEFDDAETGAEVSGVLGALVDDELSEFRAELRQLLSRQLSEVGRDIYFL